MTATAFPPSLITALAAAAPLREHAQVLRHAADAAGTARLAAQVAAIAGRPQQDLARMTARFVDAAGTARLAAQVAAIAGRPQQDLARMTARFPDVAPEMDLNGDLGALESIDAPSAAQVIRTVADLVAWFRALPLKDQTALYNAFMQTLGVLITFLTLLVALHAD